MSYYDDSVINALANGLMQVINSHHKLKNKTKHKNQNYWWSYKTVSICKKKKYDLWIHNHSF